MLPGNVLLVLISLVLVTQDKRKEGNPIEAERALRGSLPLMTSKGKVSNPVISRDVKYMAFQRATPSDPAGVGYGILLYRFK